MAYAPLGLFNDLSLNELKELRDSAIDTLANGGRTLMQWSAAGQSFQKQFAMPVKELLMELNYSIRIKERKIVKRTFARFI
jgi:hypothetical protein